MIFSDDINRKSKEPLKILHHLLEFYRGEIPRKRREEIDCQLLSQYAKTQNHQHKIKKLYDLNESAIATRQLLVQVNSFFQEPVNNLQDTLERLRWLTATVPLCVTADQGTTNVKRGTIKRQRDMPVDVNEVFTIKDRTEESSQSCCISVIQVGSLPSPRFYKV